jgi:hypothetical protein
MLLVAPSHILPVTYKHDYKISMACCCIELPVAVIAMMLMPQQASQMLIIAASSGPANKERYSADYLY